MSTKAATPSTLNISADALDAYPSEGRISVETAEGVTLRGAWYRTRTGEWYGWITERETYASVPARYVAAVTVDGERIQVLTAEEAAEAVADYYAEEAAAQEAMGTDEDAPAVRAAQIADGEAEAPAFPVEVPVIISGMSAPRGRHTTVIVRATATQYVSEDGTRYRRDNGHMVGGKAYARNAYTLDLRALEAPAEAPADQEAMGADEDTREAAREAVRVNRRGRVEIQGVTVGRLERHESPDGRVVRWAATTETGRQVPGIYALRREAVAALLEANPDRVARALSGNLVPTDEERAEAIRRARAEDAAKEAPQESAEAEAPAAVLPTISAEVTALAVDRWQDDGETIVAIHDRTGREEQDGIWGDFIGHVTLREDAAEEDALSALRAAGWTEGDSLPYALPGVSGTVTAWNR